MSETLTRSRTETPSPTVEAEHFDVLIVGAGISGVGSAYHLQTQQPHKRFVVLEAKESFGGTWLQHQYPGVRSDSDLYTFGYRFKPWVGPPIATGEEILRYMDEVIEENGLAAHIRFGHEIVSASWSTEDKLWRIEARRRADGRIVAFTTGFLWMCQGYYRLSEGYTPEWPGMADYKGRIVHPQTWPKDLDYKDKDVIIIGSGATAATLGPAMAGDCRHLTVLQRSPTYFIPGRNRNELADTLRDLEVPEEWVHEIVRRQILKNGGLFTKQAFEHPEAVKEMLLGGVSALLPEGYDVATHFTPRYKPWRQRIAFVPDGDLFQGISSGKVSVVTDEIDRFTEAGIRLKSGGELKADIIVTATGFNMNALGDIAFSVDGKPFDLHDSVTYRGMMFTGAPNLVWVFGYFRASWTLRVDLLGDFVCRLLAHMDEKGAREVEVVVPPQDADMATGDWMDEDNFNPNYLLRSMHLLPKRGAKPEWQHTQDYWSERKALPAVDLDGPEFRYS